MVTQTPDRSNAHDFRNTPISWWSFNLNYSNSYRPSVQSTLPPVFWKTNSRYAASKQVGPDEYNHRLNLPESNSGKKMIYISEQVWYVCFGERWLPSPIPGSRSLSGASGLGFKTSNPVIRSANLIVAPSHHFSLITSLQIWLLEPKAHSPHLVLDCWMSD